MKTPQAQAFSNADMHPARARRSAQALAQFAAQLTGPGARAVQTAARQLVLALELFEQNHRRLVAEALRHEEHGS